MDVGRFHYALFLVVDDLTQTKALENFQDLINNLSNLTSSPTHPTYLESYKESFKNLQDSMRKSKVLSRNMEVSRLIQEYGLGDYLGNNLFEKIKNIIALNNLAPAAALAALQEFFQEFSKKVSLLKALDSGLGDLQAPFERPDNGDSEIEIKIPVGENNSSLDELSKEAKEWNQIIKTVTEIFDENNPESKLTTISNGSWEFYLMSTPFVLYGIAKCLRSVNLVLEELIKAKGLFQDLIGIKAPQESIDSLDAHINTIVDTRFREIAEEIVNTNYAVDDSGRKAELKTALTVALKKLSKKITEGSSVDLRLTEPKAPKIVDEENPTEEESQQLQQFEEINKVRLETMQLLESINMVSGDADLIKLLEAPDE
jgi:hypothetical protein